MHLHTCHVHSACESLTYTAWSSDNSQNVVSQNAKTVSTTIVVLLTAQMLDISTHFQDISPWSHFQGEGDH